ncbi:MAG: N-6 DNA methylase [Arcobacter sp.]|nr:N-6 DNA methylase [Arcobacter sp.]
MNKVKNINIVFQNGLNKLGFDWKDDALFLTSENKKYSDPQIRFYIENALNNFQASAVYLLKQLNGSYKPQVYLFDYTDRNFNSENEIQLSEIQKKIWSSGEVPIACIFYNTEIKILDCTTHIRNNYKPVHLVNHLILTEKAHHLYNEQFAVKIKSGVFWEEQEFKNKFKFKNSAYDKLIENIRFIVNDLKDKYRNIPNNLISKIIVQSILIKYLEERIDENDNKLLSEKYFKPYDKSNTFNDVLKKGKFVDLLDDLNDAKKGFNGNVFNWTADEQKILKKLNLSRLAELLDTKKISLQSDQHEINFPNWRYFEFKYIPVELISRLYEEFLGADKKKKGLYYTPSHLAKLLVDESLPLKKYNEIDLDTFKILDPACGSGIFLVTVFKRLVQIWRLQNEMKLPELPQLKKLLRNIYGVDKEEQAVELASFSLSLALCNELNPIEIINKLKFDNLKKHNLINSDFFECKKIKNKKFDLIIGNPPFAVGAIKNYTPFWEYGNEKVKIPQGQIALKFLTDSLQYLKENGLQCLIIKSSGLLYNSTSQKFIKLFFSSLNVIQVLDFTALARNKSLWDNGVDVATAAIFTRNEKPNFNQNILHLTFRRTKATKERILFEIDDYDLHFVDRKTAIDNSFIWKNNLLGGGRISSLIKKVQSNNSLDTFLVNNNCVIGEGFIVGTSGELKSDYINSVLTLPTEAINEDRIDYSELREIDKNINFVKIPKEIIFKAPNIIIWENIGEKKLPVFYNNKNFSFKHKIIGIASKQNDVNLLKSIVSSFNQHTDFYRFYIFSTSSQVLINLNTAILKTDIMRIPFIKKNSNVRFSKIDKNIINDVNIFMQDFIRHGENSKAVKSIPNSELRPLILNYGKEFSKVLNLIYKSKKKQYRLSEVVTLNNSFIATIFKYDSSSKKPAFHSDNSKLELKELTDIEISKQLSVNRIIKLYPSKDTIVFVKPNQYRYWLSSIAYRDADKCFSDLSKLGY